MLEFDGIVELQHKGCLPVVAVGYQWVVDFQFLVNTGGLEHFFDAQHFLDLVLDGEGVLEVQAHVIPQGQLPGLFVRHHFRPEARALFGVFFQ